MKILLVADGRSPITRSWVQTMNMAGIQITLISTFECPQFDGVEEFQVIPAAFSSMAGSQAGRGTSGSSGRMRNLVGRFRNLLMPARYWLGPVSLNHSRGIFLDAVNRVKPDIVHALRIPFEGMLSRVTPANIPFVVSIWGNDLTLHAHGSPLMGKETRLTLSRADGLMADAHRDLRLAGDWGLQSEVPVLCVPGGGGIDLTVLHSALQKDDPLVMEVPAGIPVVINPRGFRPGSVRNDTFFKAIPAVLKEIPETIFVCPGMANQTEALEWVEKLNIGRSVRLLPFLPQDELWRLFKRADVSVSISQHDGTPNSLLEAMALGCVPVAGDIESTREWITNDENGYLVDPSDVESTSKSILRLLKDRKLVEFAAAKNRQIISARADRSQTVKMAESFYREILNKN